jgi:hypothetical protein
MQKVDRTPWVQPPSAGEAPHHSNFNSKWRRALRSKRFERQRQRICELRASKRARQSANKPRMASIISGVSEIIEHKVLEARLGWHKILLKIGGVSK